MPGDVLLIRYNDTYWHTMLVVSGDRIAHAPSPGEPCVTETVASFADETKRTQKWEDSELLEHLYAYRYTGDMPRLNWVKFAEQWCVPDRNSKITRYGASPNEEQRRDEKWFNYPRYRGVKKGDDDSHNSAVLPFGVDALWRTIKWVKKYRDNEAFSINRGTTCCAFIMACIQTSFVNAAVPLGGEGQQKLTQIVKYFEEKVRGDRGHNKGEVHAGGALREQSNRGLSKRAKKWAEKGEYTTDEQQVAALWSILLEAKQVLYDWETVGLPSAVNRDAKYVYSRTFNYLLSNDTAWAAK
jgi:hypothetical protein